MDNELKVSGLKLSEIRPCDNCGGQIAPSFRVVTVKLAAFNRQNVNSILGVSQIFGHKSLALAEVMAPGAGNAIEILENEEAVDQLYICQTCYCQDINLAMLAEKRDSEKHASKVRT